MNSTNQIILEHIGVIGHLKLNRPEKMNALCVELNTSITNGVQELDDDDDIKIIVISGEGRAFCAGAAIDGFSTIQSLDKNLITESLEIGIDMVKAILDCEKIVIAAVHGYCIGGGLSLALASDLCLSATNTVFFTPEVDKGMPYMLGSTAMLFATVGRQMTNYLTLTGNRINAEAALQYGLVSQVYPVDQLFDKTMDLARELSNKPAHALAAQKRISNRLTSMLIASTGNEIEEGLQCFATDYPAIFSQ